MARQKHQYSFLAYKYNHDDIIKNILTLNNKEATFVYSKDMKFKEAFVISEKTKDIIKSENLPKEILYISNESELETLLNSNYARIIRDSSGLKLHLAPKSKMAIAEIDYALSRSLLKIDDLMKTRNKKEVKVFISYAWESDKNENASLQLWLSQLRDNLQKAGISVFLDIGDMHGQMENRMKEYLEGSDVILTINTPRFKTRAQDSSTNLAFEYNLTLEKAKVDSKSILVLHYKGDKEQSIPQELYKYNIIDCRQQENFENILIESIIPHIYQIYGNDYEFSNLKKEWHYLRTNNLPEGSPDFIGRQNELESLSTSFNSTYGQFTICGKNGVGKTTLALKYAHEKKDEYNIIYYLNGNNIDKEFIILAKKLGIKVNDQVKDTSNLISKISAALNNSKNWLLIIDNIANYYTIKGYLPPAVKNFAGKQHILITSSDNKWPSQLTLNDFSKEDAHKFIISKLPNITAEQMDRLAERTKYNPAILTTEIKYIKSLGISVERYLNNYPSLESRVAASNQLLISNQQYSNILPLEKKTFSPFAKLLMNIKQLTANTAKVPTVYISLAQEDWSQIEGKVNKLVADLKKAGIMVHPLIKDLNNLKASENYIIIGTPSYKKNVQLAQQTALCIEYEEILQEAKNKPNGIFPLKFIGGMRESLPNELGKFLIRDFASENS